MKSPGVARGEGWASERRARGLLRMHQANRRYQHFLRKIAAGCYFA